MKTQQTTKLKAREERKTFHLVNIVAEKVIHLSDVGGDQMQNATSATRRGHEVVIYPNKNHHDKGTQIANQEEEDHLFVATCFLSSESSESWLIGSGCTNHMTFDRALFKDLRPTNVTKVRIGNGDYISIKGKGTIAITSSTGTRCIVDVLFIPKINQNLLSVGQLIE
eukprot:XP_025984493.1 uncharacterized protein LOC113001847 [Glycine max]